MTHTTHNDEAIAQEIQDYFFARGATIKKEDYDWLVDMIKKARADQDRISRAEERNIKQGDMAAAFYVEVKKSLPEFITVASCVIADLMKETNATTLTETVNSTVLGKVKLTVKVIK